MSNKDQNDYTFGVSVSSEESSPLVQSGSFDSLHQQHDHFPLTKDRLERKNKMDALLYNKPETGDNLHERSRSIPSNYVQQQWYHHGDNVYTTHNKNSSENSNASTSSSTNLEYRTPLRSNDAKIRRSNNNVDEFSGNTESIDSSRGHRTEASFIANQHDTFAKQGPPRRFSQLVRLSANHIAMGRSRKNRKKRHQSYVYLVFAKLSAIASRVVNSRTSEPADTRMSVNELVSLSKYLYVLKYEDNKDSKSSISSSSSDCNSIDGYNERIERAVPPAIEVFENYNDVTALEDNTLKKSNTIPTNTPAKIKRHISSLGNIFPFISIDRISLSGSESSESIEPTENDRLLSSNIPIPNYTSSQPNVHIPKERPLQKWMIKLSRFLKYDIVDPILSRNHQQLHKTTQIRFGGWSLFIFSPASLTRFFLWKIIGSRQFELLILILLFSQWMLLSFVPIRFNNDHPFFTRSADYILFTINIIYTLEAISKIIVYGLLFSAQSTSKPTLSTWIQYLRQPKINHVQHNEEDAVSQIIRDDNNSVYSYTPLQSNDVPAFAATRSISSDNNSLLNPSILSMVSRRHNQRSSNNSIFSESHLTDEPVPPWASTSTSDKINNKRRGNDEGEEETWSILTTAERQVRASITYSSCHSLDSEYNEEIGEFLKVDHQPYLTSVANVVDLVSIISYWIDVVMLLFYNKRPWSVFQAMAAMRLFRFLVVTEGTAVIMNSLRASYDMLNNVLGFFVFFWLLFSLVALFVFMNAFNRRCAVINPGQSLEKNMTGFNYVEPRISCSGYMISENENAGAFDISTGYQYSDPGGDGLYCKLGQICIQDVANQPGYGYISFENIFFAMLNILTVISTEDWTDLLYISQDSISEVSAALFYTFCIYLMTFIMVPMFIAVITTSFAHARGDMRDSAFSLQRKAKLILAASGNNGQHHSSSKNNEGNAVDDEEWVYSLGSKNIFYKESALYSWAHHLIQKKWFPYVGSILASANVIFMMFYDGARSEVSGKIESLFTLVFAMEISIRFLGCTHWKLFWKSRSNRFDLAIAVATALDEIDYIHESQCHVYLLIFRVLRSYRVSLLFPGVLHLVSDVLGDGQGLMNLTFFTFLVLFLLAPISVQLFGGDFSFVEDDEPSMRFDNSYQAFLALFQIMTGENWTDILYDAMHSQEHDSVTYAALFMIFLYFTVHYMVLNLFIAVIMENFDLEEDEIKQIQIKKYIREHQWKPEYFKMDKISRFLLPFFIHQDRKLLDFKSLPQELVAHVNKNKFHDFLSEETSPPQNHQDRPLNANSHGFFSFFKRNNAPTPRPPSVISFKSGHSRKSSIASQYSGRSLRLDSLPMPFEVSISGTEAVGKYNDEYEFNVAKENKAVIMENLSKFRSLFLLKKDHGIRKVCTTISSSERCKWLLILMICCSTLLTMWADEYNRSEYLNFNSKCVEPIQTMFLTIFCIDTFIHMISEGALMLPKSYMRNLWNILDILNLVAQIVFTILSYTIQKSELSVGYDGYLRMLRAFRSMRLVYYVQGMRVIFLDVIYGFPKMVDAVALNLLVFIAFAIYGCYIFSGRFVLCNDESASTVKDCYGEFLGSDDDNNDILLPRVWRNPYDYSFDTFGESLLHLFECASGEGWILSLFSAMSVPQKYGDQPQFNWESRSIFNSLFYVIFMFVASVCSIQLFIGVFLEIFKQRSGISSLTNTQRQFQDLQRQLALVKPTLKADRPDNHFRAFFYDLVTDKRGGFAHFMAIVLTLNIVVFATEHLHQPLWLTYTQNTLNCAFICLYVFEIGAKIVGLGLFKWASVSWNLYDFVLVGMTIATSVPKIFIKLSFGWNIASKIFLVGIAFRLAQRNESLDTLFRSVKRALPSIFFVSTVFGIVIVCFGVTFQEHFSTTKFGPYGNEHANFRTLFNSILTLFRITTGENWDFLMHDFAVLTPECVGNEDCGSPGHAFGLFIAFYVICTFIFVNLFTVIVIDNFSFTFDKRNRFTLITRTDLRQFKAAWASIDPRATGYISIDDVPEFLRQLEGALSLHIYEKEHNLSAILEASNRFDNDFKHLVSFPQSDYQITQNFAGNYMQQREQYFNFYEVNQCLSSINGAVIKERKKEFTLIYQEIIESSTHRGVAFQKMLEILAMRLVDVSKSLTFEQLVNRARIQDKIHSEIAVERAKGLVAMMVQRREYVKFLRKAKFNDSKLPTHGKQMWLSPSPYTDRLASSSLISQMRKFSSKSPEKDLNDKAKVKFEETESLVGEEGKEIPTITTDTALQQDHKDATSSPSDHIPRITIPIRKDLSGDIGLSNSYNINSNGPPIFTIASSRSLVETLDTPNSSKDSNFETLDTSSPKPLTKSPSGRFPENISFPSSFKSLNDDLFRNHDGLVCSSSRINSHDDAFTRYYAVETTIDGMTRSDAEAILNNFDRSNWSELLNSTADCDLECD